MDDKLTKLRAQFAELNIDGMLIMSEYNRRYLTNFTGTAGVAIVSKDAALFITDFRYIEQAKNEAKQFEIIEHENIIYETIAKEVARLGISQLGFEQDKVTFSEHKILEKVIQAKLIPVSDVVEKLRLLKTDREINILTEAAKIADDAFAHILNVIKAGMTEIEVANELEFFMRRQGATSASFDIIVASGVRSALPHGVASNKVIEDGDFVTMDFGAYYNGYVSDITRTIAVGTPNDKLVEIYNIVLTAQERGVAGIKPGITCKEADSLTRDYIKEQGYGQYFGHSTGHGIGMEVHEGPRLSHLSTMILQPRMVVTCEPGIYLPNLGGVRIEDDLLITETGNLTLTKAPKQLITI